MQLWPCTQSDVYSFWRPRRIASRLVRASSRRTQASPNSTATVSVTRTSAIGQPSPATTPRTLVPMTAAVLRTGRLPVARGELGIAMLKRSSQGPHLPHDPQDIGDPMPPLLFRECGEFSPEFFRISCLVGARQSPHCEYCQRTFTSSWSIHSDARDDNSLAFRAWAVGAFGAASPTLQAARYDIEKRINLVVVVTALSRLRFVKYDAVHHVGGEPRPLLAQSLFDAIEEDVNFPLVVSATATSWFPEFDFLHQVRCEFLWALHAKHLALGGDATRSVSLSKPSLLPDWYVPAARRLVSVGSSGVVAYPSRWRCPLPNATQPNPLAQAGPRSGGSCPMAAQQPSKSPSRSALRAVAPAALSTQAAWSASSVVGYPCLNSTKPLGRAQAWRLHDRLIQVGVPINDVSAVMGHEQTSTTLDRYTHPSQDRDRRVRSVFADFLLTPPPDDDSESDE
jgi:hypothetical protein